MLLSIRTVLIVLSLIVTAAGALLIIEMPHRQWLAWAVVAGGGGLLVTLLCWRAGFRPIGGGTSESPDISTVRAERRRELVRGTSMYLRELRYRYSIRIDPSEAGERKPFTTEVNTIRLGFVPVIIIDNTNDRQGFGYAAFVHDGRRWRGPGLPCPAGQSEAVKHAARCVSPLAKDEETKF